MGQHYGVQHGLFIQLFSFRFDHQHAFLGPGDNQVQSAVIFDLRHGRVSNQFAVDHADADTRNRAHEWRARNCQRRRGPNHGDHIRVVFHVMAQHGADNLHFVFEAWHEKRADRAVDQAGCQRFLFRRTCFPFEEPTRDLARSIGFFLIVNRQREKVLTGLFRFRIGDSTQNGGFAIGCKNRPVRLTGNAPGFQGQGATAPFH